MEIPGLGIGSPSAIESTKRVGREETIHFSVVKFMFEAGTKLRMKPVSLASAAHIYHRVFKECQLDDFDPYLIGTTSLYLAGKVEEDHKKLRDVINVSYRGIHKNKPPLDIGSTYWALRDSVVQCELFLVRILKFHVVLIHPHKYLVHYIKSLSTWLEPDVVAKVPFAQTAWALLRDSYHRNTCIKYPSEWIAVSVLYFALQCYSVSVPYNEEAEYRWWEAFVEDMKLTDIRKIILEMMDTYDMDSFLSK